MDIKLGKPINVLSFNQNNLDDFCSKVEYIKKTRTKLFKSEKLKSISKCPICGSSNIKFQVNIYGAEYYQCLSCFHSFVRYVPAEEMIEDFYSTNAVYSSTYTDKKVTDERLKQIAIPKVEWVIEQYKACYRKKPTKILDVGAGGGHFVKACEMCGIKAEGIEISEASRLFCKKNYDIELHNCDFVKDWKNFTGFDVITFWGVLEHTSNPVLLLKTAKKSFKNGEGFIVTEVPHWDSFSTIVQSIFSGSIIRHLDPLVHIHCFTSSSLTKAFELSGFKPFSAWYFGMDAYELIIQLSNVLRDESFIKNLDVTFPLLQDKIDKAKMSEELVFAGKPNTK